MADFLPIAAGISDRCAICLSNRHLHNSSSLSRKELKTMKADGYSDIYLWNRDVDRLIRVLQRMESIGILSKQEMKVYEVRLEEVRAALNADFSGAMATRERDDHSRLKRQRTAWENKNTKPNRK